MPNFLEQLVAEWFEFRGYYVRRNVKVGKLQGGGHGGELDVVAFHPVQKRLVHIEPSMDADSWSEREERYKKKFDMGREHVPGLFQGFDPLPNLEQIALFVSGSRRRQAPLGGGKVMMIDDLMKEIREALAGRKIMKAAVPEQYVILRSLQFAENYWK
jgi:hypothetical protein